METGRSSHEERGLKWLISATQSYEPWSLLSRGAWIEMHCRKSSQRRKFVAPLTRSVD